MIKTPFDKRIKELKEEMSELRKRIKAKEKKIKELDLKRFWN